VLSITPPKFADWRFLWAVRRYLQKAAVFR
jgi:hypothetical protein